MNKRIAAIAALGIFAISVPAVQAAPRSKASAAKSKASAAKRKAAAAEAAAKKAAAAEAQRAAAAEAARLAKLRADWGLLYDLAGRDFDGEGVPVTVRSEEQGSVIALTSWGSLGRQAYRVRRNAATGTLSYEVSGGWGGRATYTARIASAGTIEGVMKNDVSWPILKRDQGGALLFAPYAGKRIALLTLDPASKAGQKLASLISKGKVSAAGASASLQTSSGMPGGAIAGQADAPAAGTATPAIVAKLSWEDKAALLAPGQAIARETSKEDRGDSFIWRNPCFRLDVQPGKTYMVRGEFGGEINYVSVKKGCGSTSKIFAMSDEEGNRSDRTSVFTAGDDRLYADVPMRGSGRKFRISLRELTAVELAQYRTDRNAVKTAQQQAKQSSGGNSGWLGGLIMGGVAAAAGGDAGMVMGAAMKGVEMTTDNEMSRNVLAGQGDAMIQSSIDVQNQKAELERLRIAAADETRRNNAARAAGKPVAPASIASGSTARMASAASTGSVVKASPTTAGASEEKLAPKSARAYFSVSTMPGPKDTHNTHCQSTELTITIDWNPRGWGNQERANRVLEPMMPSFLAKCSREATITSAGNAYFSVEGIQHGYSYQTFREGDVQVRMP